MQDKLDLKRMQEEALETNAAEDHIEETKPARILHHKQGPTASFAKDGLYEKPSDFIRHLLAELPTSHHDVDTQSQLKHRLCRRHTMLLADTTKTWQHIQ